MYQTVSYCGDGDVREVLLPEIVELRPADHTAGIASHFLRHSLIDPFMVSELGRWIASLSGR